jgi:hypothetical protein
MRQPISLLLFALVSCNRVEPVSPQEPSLEDFLPPAPAATGEGQQVFAGVLNAQNLSQERVDGPAAQGLPGDIFLRNDKIRVIIEQPNRSLGLLPSGGNIIDADIIRQPNDPLFDPDQNPANGTGNDHWGEGSLLLRLGRNIDVNQVQIISDGSGGGAALVRFFGDDDINDFINLPGILDGIFPLPEEGDPDIDLGLEVAVDYLLEPGDDFVQVRYTLFNPADRDSGTLVGFLGDIGGISEPFVSGLGFGGAGFGELLSGDVAPAPYGAVQAAGAAYGVIPFYLNPRTQTFAPDTQGLTITIAGGLAIAYDTAVVTDLFGTNFSSKGLNAEPKTATTAGFDFVVSGSDVGVVEARYQELRKDITPTAVSGNVLSGIGPVKGARIGVFTSDDDVLDANEFPITILETNADGEYQGALAPGSYLLVADAQGFRRDTPKRVNVAAPAVEQDFTLPSPAAIAYRVEDASAPNEAFPVRISIVGVDPNPIDKRFREQSASSQLPQPAGMLVTRYSLEGDSSLDPEGDILLEDGRYRVFVSRGMEYSLYEEVIDVSAGEALALDGGATIQLTRLIDSTGYVKSDFHQHAITSPDAPVTLPLRALSYATEGTEFFASSDHDFRTDYEPIIASLGLNSFVDSVIGEETTTFDYGHFNAFPLLVDATIPNNGALDWGRGTDFFNLLPAEIFSGLRAAGARVVQINHPRGTGLTNGQYFDQAKVQYDFVNKTITSDPSAKNDLFRLPEEVQMFNDNFDAVEVYNGLQVSDENGDQRREDVRVDLILKDMANFYSLGKLATMVATSDAHTIVEMAGAPNTYVRVRDDSRAAIAANSLREDIFGALSGQSANGAPIARDAIISNTPLIRVEVAGESAIGALVPTANRQVTLQIHAEAPDWANIDTVEVFSNQIFENPEPGLPLEIGPLTPDFCFTTQVTSDTDLCQQAQGGAQPLTVASIVRNPTTGDSVLVIDITLTIDLDDLPNQFAGRDSWLFVRVSGEGSIYPIVPSLGGTDLIDLVENGRSALVGGVFPLAVTNPILLDANNDGIYQSPF